MSAPEDLACDRLSVFLAGGRMEFTVGSMDVDAASLGSPSEWVSSAILYLKGALNGTCGGTLGGTVRVSAAAIGILLTHTENLERNAGLHNVNGGPANG